VTENAKPEAPSGQIPRRKLTLDERLEAARRRRDQAASRLAALEARARRADRATETRAKIVLGGWLLAEAKRDPARLETVRRIAENLDRSLDRDAVERVLAVLEEA
jgi:hypothetical protein